MINKFWVLIDRIKEKILFYYRRKVFLARIGSNSKQLRILGKVYVNATNIRIGKNVIIYPEVYFWGDGEILIGNNVDLGKNTIIFSKNKVVIGNDVAIAANCYIIDSNHSIETGKLIREQPLDVSESGITIGSDVWIGAGSYILKGARINDGAVIGAMSLVNREIPKNRVAFGIPSKDVKYRR